MPAAKPPTQAKRKRTRKRKRRAASSSSSSSSSDSSSSENEQEAALPVPKALELSSSDSESKTSSSSDSSDDETARRSPRGPIIVKNQTKDSEKPPTRRLSPSPSPPPAELPSFLPSKGDNSTEDTQMKEQELKTKFRQFWMSSIADGFRDDLDEIRKEPNLGTSRLALLIDSLASGADLFSSSGSNSGVNEMEVILG